METKTEMKLGDVLLHPTDRKLSFRCSECGLQMDLVQQFLMHSLQHVMCLGECEVTEIVSQAINGATTVKDTEECQERDEDTDIDKPDLAKVVEEEVAFVDTYTECTSPSVSQFDSDEELTAAEFTAAISTPPLEETTEPKVTEKFKCYRCATVVNTSKRLLRHMRVAHQETIIYMCDICGATFTTMSNCKIHTRRHNAVKAHERTPQSSGLYRHMKTHRNVGKSPQKTEVTEECQERDEDTDIDKPYLAKVVEGERATVDTYKDCTSPSVSQFDSDEELTAEFVAAICKPPLEETTEPKVNTSKRLLPHMKVAHLESAPYMCDICGATFSTMNSCKVHTRRHTNAKAHACEVKACGKSFHTTTELRLHRRSHTDERPFQCTECAATYKSSSSLSLHRRRKERTHNEDRLFKCTLCDSSFKRVSNLRLHMHQHREFACEVCGNKFAQRSGLHSHMKTHRNASKKNRVREKQPANKPQ